MMRILPVFTKLESKAYRGITEKTWNTISITLFECVWQHMFGQTDANTDPTIIFIFAFVTFIGVSYYDL
jgi:hypothetical protein